MRSPELIVVVTDADGRTVTLDSHASRPGDRPRGITFGSQLASGFYTASFTLARPIDAEHDDLHLGDDVRIVTASGDTVWEGWIQGLPRSMDTEHSLTVNCSGYMALAADEPFSEIFVDRDLSSWRPASRARLVNLIAQTYRNTDASVLPDVTSGEATLLTAIGEANWIAGILPCSEAWYDAGQDRLGFIYFDWERANDTNHISPWYWDVAACTVDDGSVAVSTTGNLKAATSTPNYFDAGSKRFGRLFFGHTASPNTGSEGLKFGLYWKRIAVYGDHGLTLIGDDPKGITASDALRYVFARYCPQISTAGVQDTSYPIAQLVAADSTVYDFALKLNSFHLWDLAVWEGPTLHFKPLDLSDWDWEIRHDEVGNQIGLQGDSFDNLRNGLIVAYTDVATGAAERLHPDNYAELRDDSIDNPATLHGRRKYGPDVFTIPFPTTADNALELGRIKLADDLQVRAAGSFTITGQVRDRSGQMQPVSSMRSGDRIRLTSSASLSERPRLIHEVAYAHDGLSATVAVDSTLRYVEAYLDRTATALAAAGLT